MAPAQADSVAGFLFVEFRGPETSDALSRFRGVVHSAVARYPKAVVRIEGRTFFVVFPSTAEAIECGLALAQRIEARVGVDAGPVAMPEGLLVASAAGAVSEPGEVVVTARARQQARAAAAATPLRRPIALTAPPAARQLYLAKPAGSVVPAGRRGIVFRRRWLAATAVVLIVVAIAAAATWWGLRPAGGVPVGALRIGVLVPERGGFWPMAGDFGQQQANAVKLAVDEANSAGWLGAASLTLDVRDEGNPGAGEFASSAAINFAEDPRVFAVVGPSASSHAELTIPVTNRAGLLQCSPATTRPSLTKPHFGALELRSAFPDRINFVRLATSDDAQGPAAASYDFNDLGAAAVLIVDDTSDAGRQAAGSFETAYSSIAPTAGNVERRSLNPGTTDFRDILQPLQGTGAHIGAVYFAGYTTFENSQYAGPVLMKQAMSSMGFLGVPVQSWDGLWDGSGTDEGSFIQRAGSASANTYATRASVGPVNADFASRYRAAFGVEPNEFTAAAYACTQIILEGLRNAGSGVDATGLREAVRSYVVNPAHRYQTVVGSVGFDANGDSTQQFVTFYRVDLGANGGKGDWIIVKQQDFGPAG